MQPGQAQQTQVDQLRQQIRALKGQLTLHEGKLETMINQQLKQIESKIAQCDENIRFLENGGILVRSGSIRAMVGEFLGGWNGLLNLLSKAEDPQLTDKEIALAADIADNWLDKRIKGLGASKSTKVQLED